MGLQRYWTGVVDALTLEEAAGVPCSCLVPNPEVLISDYSGNSVQTADGRHSFQIVRLFKVGIAFSIIIEQCPQALYNNLKAQIAAKIPTETHFRVTLTDGIDVIDLSCFVDLPQWITRGEPSGAYVQNVQLNFISMGA